MKKQLFACAIAILCLGGFGYPSGARASLLNIQEVVSPGGITAWLIEDHSVPVIALEFAFRGAGSIQDSPEKQGLVRMASNTMDEGAGDLNAQAFQKELRDRVISLHFGASRDHFSGSLKTLTKNKARAFTLLNMALTSPRFEAEAVARMRAANESRIRSSLSDPEWMAARLQNDKVFAGHPYALNSGGTLSSLDRITSADLQKFHKTMLGKNNLAVAVAGDIEADDLALALDEIFGALPSVTIAEPVHIDIQNQGKIFLLSQDTPQTIIEIMQPGIKRNDPAYHTAQVMNFILGSSGFGSRLTEEIREKRGLTYGIYTGLQSMDYADGLNVSTSTANENVPEMLKLVRAEFMRMQESMVTDQELADAKSYLIGSLPLSLTSTDSIAGLALALQLDHLPRDYLDVRERSIRAVSAGDIKKLAESLLAPAQFTTVMVGNPAGLNAENTPNLETITSLPNVQ
ncbi:MAG: insulinase family protein [Alphaproteobacteria bacterium]|nr:insulinase family protein [Alphaproteobacteria bacterium]